TIATLVIAGYGIATAAWQLMLVCLVFNALEAAGTIVWATIKQHHVPVSMLGRVSSLDWLISIGLLPLSFALTAPVAAVFGVRATLVGAAALADAGHLFTDAAALAFALVASAMAARPATGRWTFGYSRLEILAAQANGITLGLIALWVIWSAVHRLVTPHDVRGGLVLVVALGGVAASVAASLVLARASRESLKV